jgi:hypothetical protein
MAMLLAKQKELPLPPGEVARGVPEDLAALAMDLLAPRAEDRPTGAEVLARLGWQQRALSRRIPPQPSQAASFIGRERERMALHEALLEARSGKLTTAFLSGRSGMGKSALAGRFLADVRAIENTVVLEGRCYEREAVPYKAFDSLFDALARHLGRLSPERRSALLPPDVHALGRLFPALSAVAPPTRRGRRWRSTTWIRRSSGAARSPPPRSCSVASRARDCSCSTSTTSSGATRTACGSSTPSSSPRTRRRCCCSSRTGASRSRRARC